MDWVVTLFLLPITAAVLMLALPQKIMQYLLSLAVLGILGAGAFVLITESSVWTFKIPYPLHLAIIGADIALLLFFWYQGKKFGNLKVMFLALLQLFLYGYIETIAPEARSAEIVVDHLSRFMFMIINIVGGIIVLYALKYMEDEPVNALRKRLFIGALLVFLSVMNLIVSANSILLFFFLFEMTTLASYLLIAFRNDQQSRANALKALWMNQIGGVVILLGALVAITQYETVMFDALLEHSGGILLFAVALLSMAALVKGASLPFEGWLLGAMVAPTPVSAMLHSATMVKIAPYLILKLAPALALSVVGGIISVIGALVFVAASYLALSRSMFKEVLGYSTVALLGLMMALAAIGTAESIALAMALMLFHALSKALLFLSAGALERLHHAKELEQMKGMVERSPKAVGFILFGFVSLTLPPFGLFMGKMFAIESVASLLGEQPLLLIVVISLIMGSALLVLLYFKVASALLSASNDVLPRNVTPLGIGFSFPLWLLSFLTFVSAMGYVLIQPDISVGVLLLPLVMVLALPLIIRSMDGYDRSQPYHCGEKKSFDAALVYYEPSGKVRQMIYWAFGILFVSVAMAGVVS